MLEDGTYKEVIGWQELQLSKIGDFHPKMKNQKRWLSAVDVPDLELLPKHIASVTNSSRYPIIEFRAGLENPMMHLGLWSISFLAREGLIKNLAKRAKFLKALSETKPFYEWIGSDTAGMFIKLEGWSEPRQKNIKVIWRLYAGSGEGVQIPATAAVLLTEKFIEKKLENKNNKQSTNFLKIGAYPCLSLVSKEEFMSQFKLYDIEDDIVEEEF